MSRGVPTPGEMTNVKAAGLRPEPGSRRTDLTGQVSSHPDGMG